MKWANLALVVLVLLASNNGVTADTVVVYGRACPFFAGQDSSSLEAFSAVPTDPWGWAFDNDKQAIAGGGPHHLLPPFLAVGGASTVHLTAAGLWDHTPYGSIGPGGEVEGDSPHFVDIAKDSYRQFGISVLTGPGGVAPLDLLVGVFLTDAPPSGTTPPDLSYGADDMTHPALQQLFAIGTGPIDVQVPAGATRLFFGLNDGSGWYDNSGYVTVTADLVPEPSAVALLAISAMGLLAYAWRRRKPAK